MRLGVAYEVALAVRLVQEQASNVAGRNGWGRSGAAPNVAAEDWRPLVCALQWAWPCGWALRVVYGGAVGCPTGESNGDPFAVGRQWYRGELWYFYGLWQIASRLPPDDPRIQFLFDPYLNTVEAHLKFLDGGASHWPVCGR